jgi:hypothetical protein
VKAAAKYPWVNCIAKGGNQQFSGEGGKGRELFSKKFWKFHLYQQIIY